MTEPTPSADDDVWTVNRILQWTTGFLEQKGVESARLESELLLAHARNCQRIRLYTDLDVALTDDERTRMRELVKQRAQRVPLAYITGRREFYGRDFRVGPGVLVPRPETETLVDRCLERIDKTRPAKVCEVGFGSGCVAITLACQRPNLTVVASDTSPDAMKFATLNAGEHKVAERVQLVSGDGFEPIRAVMPERFDGIVSNPPYVREDEMAGLQPEVAQHEPREALVSGEDGLVLIRRLVAEAPELLVPGGWMALEMDPAQCEGVAEMFRQAGFEAVETIKDLSGNDRIVEGNLAADT